MRVKMQPGKRLVMMVKSSTLTTYTTFGVSSFYGAALAFPISYVNCSIFLVQLGFSRPLYTIFLFVPDWPSMAIFSTSKMSLLDPPTNLAIISETVRLLHPIPSQTMTWLRLIGSSGIFTEMSQLPRPRLPLVSPRSPNRIPGLWFRIGG